MVAVDPPQPPTRIERFVDGLLARDGAGGSWLRPLLEAAPGGEARFGELVERPGWLQATVAVRTETGRRGAFEHPAAPAPDLLRWYVDHPERLSRAGGEAPTEEARRLRRMLLEDDPPGSRAPAQARARALMRESPGLAPTWWRFEEPHRSDCVLITDRLVLLLRDGDDARPATAWFPDRSGRVRDLEAAERIAAGEKPWAVLGLATEPTSRDVAEEVLAGAPHLGPERRAELAAGDLGELGWDAVAAAVA